MKQSKESQELGGAFALVCLLAGGAMVSCSSPSPEATDPTPAPATRSTSTSVSLESWHDRPVLELMIGGAGPFSFILDTGASITVVDRSLVAQLDLATAGETEIGSPLGGTVAAKKLRLPEVRAGAMPVGDVEALAIDLASVVGSKGAPVGVLATAAFENKSLTFDFARARLLVSDAALPPADNLDVHDFCAPGGKPSISVEVGGQSHCVNIDTGGGALLALPLAAAAALPLDAKPTLRGKARLVGAQVSVYGARLRGLVRVGRVAIRDPELTFHETAPIGVLGQTFLQTVELTLDHANRRSRVRDPGASSSGSRVRVREAPPAKRRYGIRFAGPLGGELRVAAVEPQSPSAMGGLLSGDLIVALDGVPVTELDTAARLDALKRSPLHLRLSRNGAIMELTLHLE